MPAHAPVPATHSRCYGNSEVTLSFTTYSRNGRTCLRLLPAGAAPDAPPLAVCTVNLPSVPMDPGEVAIKTWHENVGMLGWLIDEGIVSHPLRYLSFAGVFIPVCALLVRPAQAG